MSIEPEMKACVRDPERVHQALAGWATPEGAIYSDAYFDRGGGLTAGDRGPGSCGAANGHRRRVGRRC